VPVSQAHPAERKRQPAFAAPLRGAHDVRLHRLLATPVASHPQLAVVHPRAHRKPPLGVVAVAHRTQVVGSSLPGRAGRPSSRRRELRVFVVQAGYIRVVHHDSVPGRAPALGFGDERAVVGFPGLRD
jgi:hypothetical protein